MSNMVTFSFSCIYILMTKCAFSRFFSKSVKRKKFKTSNFFLLRAKKKLVKKLLGFFFQKISPAT